MVQQKFEWTLVRLLLVEMDQGTLLGATRVLKAGQPTIGRHIAELESQLGAVVRGDTLDGGVDGLGSLRLTVV